MTSGTTTPCPPRPPRPGCPRVRGELAHFHRALLRLSAHELGARAAELEARRDHPGEDPAWWDATVALDRLLRHSGRWYAAGVAGRLAFQAVLASAARLSVSPGPEVVTVARAAAEAARVLAAGGRDCPDLAHLLQGWETALNPAAAGLGRGPSVAGRRRKERSQS